MAVAVVLLAAVAFQLAAAILAVRLIRVTGNQWAWGLIASAILVMLARRCLPLFRSLMGDPSFSTDLPFELVGLAISVCLFAGMAGVSPLFHSMRRSAERIEHFNAVLRAIRNVNQLIAREKDRDRLLEGICESLIQTRGYRHAWIALLDDSGRPTSVVEAGFGDGFLPLRARMERGEPAPCMQTVLAEPAVLVLGEGAPACRGCPLCDRQPGSEVMAVRMACGGDVYGMMVAALPESCPADEEEQTLVQETAGDIALALRTMQLEEERGQAEKGLRLDESRLEALVQLSQMADASLRDITDFALEEAVRLTESRIGYLAFMNADESVLTMHSWSKTAMRQCEIFEKPVVYQVAETGLWGEAVRQRKPIITNDYAAENPWKKGYPEGHVRVTRHMNVPVFEGGRIVVVAGVGNKEEPYDEADVRQLNLLMQGMWRLIQRRDAEEELRRARDELEIRVRERTAELAAANEELKQERYLLHTLMDYLPHNIYFKDAESRFIRINKAMASFFGLADASEALEKTDLDFFTGEHAEQALADEREIVRTGRPLVDKEERETWPDGHTTWASTTKMPLRDETGRIVGTFGISRDITRQKEAEDALRTSEVKYRTLFNSSQDAIMMLTPEEGFLTGNPAAVELFGCADEAQFTSLTPADLSPEYQPDGTPSSVKAQEMMAIAAAKGAHLFEWTHKRVDGEEFSASVLLNRLELEGKELLQATVRDITEQKRAAEALRAAKEAAEAASRAKSTFLANMSHEIRTPLNAIIGMTELVMKSELSAQQREFLSTVRDSGEALLSVINDILDFSKIEAGKLVLDCHPFDLWESLGDTMKSFALRAHQQGLELAFRIAPDVPREVVGDYGRLRQVVVNLVGNAIKFTEKGEVVVRVYCESLSPREVNLHFTVRDTGMGIAEEKRSAIFAVFEQADSSMTRRHGGTGLGLSIASRLVDLMDGRIWVESEQGRGSHFHFTVHLGLPEDRPLKTSPAEPACLHGLRVLVVDDNATNRRILEEILRGWHMPPATARDACEALEVLREAAAAGNPFRLVLTDAQMPDVDGFTLAEQIKRDASLGSTVVMMLTSGDRPEDAARCEQLGIAAYLLKPVKESELLEAIELALGVRTLQEASLEPTEPRRSARSLRVLLAEDSLVNQKLAVALLEREGHTVTVATNGREALWAAETQQFDLVLMDVQMPEMDGLEATAEIRVREMHSGGHLPIIAMTAHALKGDRERCLAAGMDGYVAKPIRADELFEAIGSFFSQS